MSAFYRCGAGHVFEWGNEDWHAAASQPNGAPRNCPADVPNGESCMESSTLMGPFDSAMMARVPDDLVEKVARAIAFADKPWVAWPGGYRGSERERIREQARAAISTLGLEMVYARGFRRISVAMLEGAAHDPERFVGVVQGIQLETINEEPWASAT